MKIKLINYGGRPPQRSYSNDVGADICSAISLVLWPGKTEKVPLGIGVEIPIGYAGFIFPRSGLSAKGIGCELPPIDPGYTGEIHAILHNIGDAPYQIEQGERIGQLVIVPVAIVDFVEEQEPRRGTSGFGSTGQFDTSTSAACTGCPVNPKNGGNGICNCTLALPKIT